MKKILKLNLVAFFGLTALLMLPSCQTTQETISSAKTIKLSANDADNLVGVWEDNYETDNGYRGTGVLTITPADKNYVNGVFVYIYNFGKRSRFPDKGTKLGIIKEDGKLHFGSWALTMIERGGKYTLTTRQPSFGTTVNFYWSRDDFVLQR